MSSEQKEFNFSVNTISVMDENGKIVGELPKLTNDEIKELYKKMLTIRVYDEKTMKIQRQGRVGPYISYTGQEACQVGIVFTMRKDDWFFPTYRDSGALYARGMPLKDVLLYWMGDARGFKNSENNFPICIPVGTHPPHAAGAAFAAKIKGKDYVSVATFGDGATSRGDFYEAMNFAGVFKLPVIFAVQNNQWAISVPRNKQTASQTIAQKAIAAGIEGIVADGNDIFSVVKAMRYAIEKARSGKGATVIEFMTYRLGDHSSADDQKKYRDPVEVEMWKKKEPIERLKKFMLAKGLWNEKFEQDIIAEATQTAEKAVADAENIPSQKLDELFENIFSEMTPNLKEELEELKESYKDRSTESTNKVEKIEGSFP
ncbi:MAG: pyruvate dehydrogenase (acetyl-transferring) E1 component subunit alpha [Candidatus Aenigmarchaeota archaeon]|nr:pyruvate dehydrogenase (acetyl-transferring) E1 component subunit alpha [Candidatus Aenigmarchaeota archaeon]